MKKQRLVMKLVGNSRPPVIVHVDIDGSANITEERFRAEAKSVAERLGKQVATRPASKARAKKKTATRSDDET